ncbi:hypothetical protein [Curtobacterium sp. MCBD17_008]|uniref:hypothetical protein n=1 Tax=Curtobacterium sp. MCBD17_008 TaxID=2175656 RepID=UPI0011B4AB03|nr:hypothetical protein [Curtobacterium sp. MCBD17_008]
MDLQRPVHGVRVARASDATMVDVLTPLLRPDQFFSHTTAAALWGAPLPRRVRADVHVTTAGTAALMRCPGITAHRAQLDVPTVTAFGTRLSTPERSWWECASVLTVRELVAVGDALVGRRSLTTIDRLAAAIRPGHRHVRVARAALELVRVGAESPMETWFRLAIVDAGFPEPDLNVEVFDAGGVFLGRVDMAWPEQRIAFEYDGDHHRDRDVFHHDHRRDNGFVVNDWLVVHATAVDAARPALVFERLRQAFAARSRGA